MTMQERIGRLNELLLTLFDPRTDEDIKADLINAADAALLRDVATIACVWVGETLVVDAVRGGVSLDQVMERVQRSLEQGAAEYDRLNHEGGLFT